MFIHDTLDRARRLYPHKEAVIDGALRMTYAELAERVDRLAGVLVAAGVRPGDRVGVIMQNRHRYMEAYFAAEKAGAVLTPINQRLAPPEAAFIINDAAIAHLLIDTSTRPLYEAFRARTPGIRFVLLAGGDGKDDLVEYERAIASAAPLAEPARKWAADDMIHLYYTSGTTGQPKGVILTQRNVMANARNAIMTVHFDESTVWIHATPMFHLADAWSCWTITWVGGVHVFLPEFSPPAYLELLQAERVTHSVLVPTMINAVVHHPSVRSYDVPALSTIMFGAAPMPADRLKQAMEVFPHVTFRQLYGMTETAPFATDIVYSAAMLDGADAVRRRFASCGREIPGVRVRVVTASGADIASGDVGEIIMQGENVTPGYWQRPEATAEAVRDGWVYSGDLATVDAEGYIFIVDRKKDMIISGGENIFSTEVEAALYEHPAVLEAAVIGIPDVYWGERVHAEIVCKPGQTVTDEEIVEWCRARIARYKSPRSIAFVESLPKTGSGKIQKAVIRDRYWQAHEALTGSRV